MIARQSESPAPPLPMYTPAQHPDAWHRVHAPGGYEWWYFDAESRDGRTRLVAIFLEGFIFHPGYRRRHAAYLRRPTRTQPVTAADFPCAYFVVYHDGKVLSQFMTQYGRDDFRAETDRPAVTIGPNTMRLDEEGIYRLHLEGTPWALTARGPQLQTHRTLQAEISFRPAFTHEPIQRRFLSREMTGADHEWVLTAPRCSVAGTVRLGETEAFEFTGRGYHDHNFGTAPVGPGLKRWIWGRMLTDRGVVGFHFARPDDPALSDEVHVLEAGPEGMAELDTRASLDWSRKTGWRLAYPQRVDFGDVLRLSNPRVIDSAPFYMRLVYEATSRGHMGTAFCEVAYPHRVRHPMLGRMVEMSIEKRKIRMAKPE